MYGYILGPMIIKIHRRQVKVTKQKRPKTFTIFPEGSECLPNKCESAALTCVAIPGYVDVPHLAAPLEDPTQILRRGAICEIVDL